MLNAVVRSSILAVVIPVLIGPALKAEDPKPKLLIMYQCWVAAKCNGGAICKLYSGTGNSTAAAEDAARMNAQASCNGAVEYCEGVSCGLIETLNDEARSTSSTSMECQTWKVKFLAQSRKGNWFELTASGRTLCEAYQNARKPVITFINDHECGVCRCCWQIVEYPCKSAPCRSNCCCR